jgi:cobalt-precorrin 5A hydrolase
VDRDEAMIVAGIGCRRRCPSADIVALVRRAEAVAGIEATALAAPDFKQDEPGLIEAAAALGLGLKLVAAPSLEAAQSSCRTRSLMTTRHTGFASVAEGVALAAAGPGSRLLLARIADASATCALAIGGSE